MSPRGTIALATLALLLPSTGISDEVTLSNGDRLTGTVVTMEEGTLTFDAEIGGEVTLPWSSVTGLVTDAPVPLTLAGGSRLVGVLVEAPPGLLRLEGPEMEAPVEVALEDVASVKLPPPSERFGVRPRAHADLGASLTRGNTSTDSYRGSAELEARTRNNRYTIGGEFTRAEEDRESTVDRTIGYARYDHFVSDRWFFNTNVDLTSDAFRNLDLRTTAGAGFGYQLFETDARRLSTTLGLSFIDENFSSGPDESNGSGRWAVAYEEILFGSGATLAHNQEILLGFETSDDLIVRTRTGLRFPFFAGITASTELAYDRDQTPAPGAEKEDVAFTFSLGYEWDPGR